MRSTAQCRRARVVHDGGKLADSCSVLIKSGSVAKAERLVLSLMLSGSAGFVFSQYATL
jgi:hypothetical protein